MAYRKMPPPPKPARRTMQKVSTPHRVYMHNGQIANLAIPCWYQEIHRPERVHIHDRKFHDHVGWPEPRRVDRSCQSTHHMDIHRMGGQMWWPGDPVDSLYTDEPGGWHWPHILLDPACCFPIHLTEEGYDHVKVLLGAEGATASGWIDDDDDWIVRVMFTADAEDSQEPFTEPTVIPFSVFAHAQEIDRLRRERNDLLANGELVILPAITEGV